MKFWKEHTALRMGLMLVAFVAGIILLVYGWKQTGQLGGLGLMLVGVVLLLVTLIKRTRIGMAMRAASRDFETSQLMGIKINSVISFTFIIGTFLAAIGSLLDRKSVV